MKAIFFFCFVLISKVVTAQSPLPEVVADSFPLTFNYHRDYRRIKAQTEDKSHAYYYQKMIIRFLDVDSSLTRPDVLALLIGFTENQHYKPYENMDIEKEIIELNDNGFYDEALEETKKYLQKNPLSLCANKERSFAYHQLGKSDSARYFMNLNNMIMEAMIFSGGAKGKTPETAFFSLGLNDGDYFIPNVGLTPTKKSITKDKNRYTIYAVVAMNIESAYTNYYFNIHHAKMKADQDGISEKKSNKLEKAKKKKAASKKGKKGALKDSTTVEEPENLFKPSQDSLPTTNMDVNESNTTLSTDSIPAASLDSIPTGNSEKLQDSPILEDSLRVAPVDSLPLQNTETPTESPSPEAPVNEPPGKGPMPITAIMPKSKVNILNV